MIMQMINCSIFDGTGGSLLSNDGGILQVENMEARGLSAVGLLVAGNFAKTEIIGLRVLENDLTYVTFATISSQVTLLEGFISENRNLSEVFFASDNSGTFVDTTSVVNNQIGRSSEETGWIIGSANGTNTTFGMNNMLIEANTNIRVSFLCSFYACCYDTGLYSQT